MTKAIITTPAAPKRPLWLDVLIIIGFTAATVLFVIFAVCITESRSIPGKGRAHGH